MFDVERSSADRITINDRTLGRQWTFVVVTKAGEKCLSSDGGEVACRFPADGPRSDRARTFADIEAWKRGLID